MLHFSPQASCIRRILLKNMKSIIRLGFYSIQLLLDFSLVPYEHIELLVERCGGLVVSSRALSASSVLLLQGQKVSLTPGVM